MLGTSNQSVPESWPLIIGDMFANLAIANGAPHCRCLLLQTEETVLQQTLPGEWYPSDEWVSRPGRFCSQQSGGIKRYPSQS